MKKSYLFPRIIEKRKPIFSMQWHITSNCLNRCKHCYMERNKKSLPLESWQKIADDLRSLTEVWDCRGRILFTGGDPLLYPDFFKLLSYVHKNNPSFILGVLGNPELLTEKIISELKANGVSSYQLSIDGIEKTHDRYRYGGSYNETLAKIDLLKKNGMKTVIMTTVSNDNFMEVPEIFTLMINIGVDLFGFHRLVPIGNGVNMKNELIAAESFKWLLNEIFEINEKLKTPQGMLGTGEPLWGLLLHEKGLLGNNADSEKNKLVWNGCSIGCAEIDILEDGTALACRRLPIPIGKLPDKTIRDIFLLSPVLNEMRKIDKIERCKNCKLLLYCRGCRAIARAVSGDYFKPDPQCWQNSN